MITKRAVLAVEGKLTNDGREIRSGGLTWRRSGSVVPILVLPEATYSTSTIIGFIDDITRDGSLIIGTAYFPEEPDPELFGVGVDLDFVDMYIREDLTLVVWSATIRGVHLNRSHVWPEAVLS